MVLVMCRLVAFSADTTRIRVFKNHISLAAHLTQINLNTILENDQEKHRIEYNTATATRLGLSFDYRWLAFELFTHLPYNQNNREGSTKNSGIYGRINKSRFWANVIYQRFSGFYWNNPDLLSREAAGGFPKRADIVNRLFQANAYYVFRPDKFSNMAAQGENEWQLKSGGSFFAGVGFYSNIFSADTSIIPGPERVYFPEHQYAREIIARSYVLSGGYAHTFVVRKKIYAALYLAPGLSRFTAINKNEDDTRYSVKGEWAFRLESKISVGYNSGRYFGGVMFSSFLNNQDLGTGTSFSYGFNTFRLYFGRRFQLQNQLGLLGL